MSLLNQQNEKRFIIIISMMSGMAACLVFCILIYLAKETWPFLHAKGALNLFRGPPWNPSESSFNLLPMVIASLATSLCALFLALPLGVLSAIYICFYASPWLARLYRSLIQLLAGIPSVVYGFWGLTCLVPAINRWNPPGASLLAGSLVLSIMILPTLSMLADSSFSNVPKSGLNAGQALGMSRLGIIRCAVWPYSRKAIVAATVLAFGRALGETMALVMVCGNIVQIPRSLFDPVRTLTANIALEMAYAVGQHRASLFCSGLILILVVIVSLLFIQFFVTEENHAS